MIKIKSKKKPAIEILSHVDTLNSSLYEVESVDITEDNNKIYNCRFSFNVDLQNVILNNLYNFEININPIASIANTKIVSQKEISRYQRYDGVAFLSTLSRRGKEIQDELKISAIKNEENKAFFSLVSLLADFPVSSYILNKDPSVFGTKQVWKYHNANSFKKKGLVVLFDQMPIENSLILKENMKNILSLSEPYFDLIRMGRDPSSGIFGKIAISSSQAGASNTVQITSPGGLVPGIDRGPVYTGVVHANSRQDIIAQQQQRFNLEDCNDGDINEDSKTTNDPMVFQKNQETYKRVSLRNTSIFGKFKPLARNNTRSPYNGLSVKSDILHAKLFLPREELSKHDLASSRMTGAATRIMSLSGEKPDCPPRNSDSLTIEGGQFVKRFETSNRIRTLSLIVPIHEDHISAGVMNLVIKSITQGKTVNQVLKFSIPTSEIKLKNNMPRVIPQIKIEEAEVASGNSAPLIYLRLPGITNSVIGYVVHVRSLSETQPMGCSYFSEIHNSISSIQNRDVLIPAPQRISSFVDIFRSMPILSDGTTLSNFTSCENSSNVFISKVAILQCTSTSTGVEVRPISSSPGSKIVAILRRKMGERKWEEFPIRNSAGLIDESAREFNTYEYSSKIRSNANFVMSSTITTHYHVKPAGIVAIKIGNVSIGINESSFTVSGTTKATDFSKIATALTRMGLSSLYMERIKRNRSLLGDLVFFKVDRQDMKTGKIEYMGCYASGETVVETKAYSTARIPDRKYKYRAFAVLVSPSDAMDNLFNSGRNTERINPKNPQTLKAYQNTLELSDNSYDNSNINVNPYDRILNSRTMQTSIMKSGQVNSSLNSIFSTLTGDFIEIDTKAAVVLSKIKTARDPVSINFDGSILVKWNCKVNSTSNIDFFIVSSHTQGITNVVGKAHPLQSEGGNITFLDTKNSTFIGKIEYSVTPVLLNGSVGSQTFVGNIVKGER